MSLRSDIKIYRCLLPFSWLFRLGVGIRNILFDRGILPSRSFDMPVICIGNLTVGGTGKTPHTEYLIRLLKEKYQVAVLSRGYKRKSKGFVQATARTPLEQIGDEPFQMAHKFPEIHMAVDENRCHGIEQLMTGGIVPKADVILLDDAFQHRYVKAGLSILLIDYHRPIFRDCLLPAGRLREPMSGKSRADIIIVSKCPARMTESEQAGWLQSISPSPRQQVYFSTLIYGDLQPLFSSEARHSLRDLSNDTHILLLTGIASPKTLIEKLQEYTQHVTALSFSDHHDFKAEDLSRIGQCFSRLPFGKKLIVTTEKDAARLIGKEEEIAETLRPYMYVLPVSVGFLQNKQQLFNQNIIEYVRKNSRDSRLSEG